MAPASLMGPLTFIPCTMYSKPPASNKPAITFGTPVEPVQVRLQKAMALHQSGQLAQAKTLYEGILATQPRNADALSLLAIVATQTRDYPLALETINKAIKINPANAGYYLNRGAAQKELRMLTEAVASFDKAIALKPDYAEAYSNRGIVQKELKQIDAAIASLDRAIALKPGHAEAYWNKSNALLISGDYERGWPLYEWRWKLNDPNFVPRNYTQPLWLGLESVQGKTVYLYGEQGLGDTLQLCRYAKLVKDLGARVVMEVPLPLKSLLQRIDGVDEWVLTGTPPPTFDYHCPLVSLPLALKTTLSTIPGQEPYLHSNELLRAQWSQHLGPRTVPRVGLVWSGNPVQLNDHNRSIPLERLLAYLPPGLEYVSLQKDPREADRATLSACATVRHLGDDFKNYDDTAAVCALMDVVVSVCTSVAHLSAGLGCTTWVLLAYNSDWRWLHDRTDSPWYPSAQLYRQATPGDWSEPMSRLQNDLVKLAGQFPGATPV